MQSPIVTKRGACVPYFDQLPPCKLACSVTDFFRLHRPHVMYTVPVGQNPTGAVSHNCLDGQIVLFLRCRTYYLSTGRHKIPPSISLRHSDLRASLFFYRAGLLLVVAPSHVY